jgi:single-strand DNA-binding protein
MSDLNKVLVTGILAQDIELRFTPDGTKTANLRVAIHRRYKTKAGEIKAETEFVTAVVWKILAETCAKYLKKGSKVLVEGRLKTREYVDKDQQKRSITEIIAEDVQFLDTVEKKEV